MNRSESISLDQIKQLIPINGDLVNFVTHVKIVSESDRPFLMAVVSEAMLESSTDLPYRSVTKREELTIRNDNNVYEKYVLVLKSDSPQKVLVSIALQETPLTATGACGRQTTIYPPQIGIPKVDGNGGFVTAGQVDTPWYKDWRYLLAIAILVALILYFYMRSRKKEEPTIIEMSTYTSNLG